MTDTVSPQGSPAEIFGSDRMWGLKEMPLPEPVSWLPQTVGWYVVLAAVLLAIAGWCWHRWRRYRRNAYRRKGLADIEEMASGARSIEDLPLVLRRSALRAGARADVAGLRGADWLAWLNRSAARDLFRQGDADMLDRFAYGGVGVPDERDRSRLLDASRTWMRVHRVSV